MRVKPLALVIDDDAFFRRTLEVVLSRLGLVVKVMEKPEEFLPTVLSTSPDLLFIDLHIGELSGLKLVEEIRANGLTTPIVVVSGEKSSETVSHALELGANEYILKPFDKGLLANKLAQFVNTEEIDDQGKMIHKVSGNGIEAKVSFSGKIIGVDELGIQFLTPHLSPKGTILRLGGDFVKELTGDDKECLACVTATALRPGTNSYEIYAEFESADLHVLQAVRRWLTNFAKQKAA